jgi:hypothetical protein
LTAGVAITNDLSLEATGFALTNNSASFAAQSNGAGLPIVTRPVIRAGTEGAFGDSFPGLFAGGANVDFRSSFYGIEANALKGMSLAGSSGVGVVFGFRYLHLSDDLRIDDNFAGLVPGSGLTFLGNLADPPTTLTDFDRFRTANGFDGVQIGARDKLDYQNWELSGAVKVAFGVTHETVDIQGATTLNTPGAAAQTAPGGILAQVTNIGHYTSDRFTVVPELEVKAAYQIARGLWVHVGYDIIYWSDVARAGNQIDRTVNPGIVPSDQLFGTPGGPARPAFTFNHTDFWAQGITAGLEYRY